MRTVPAGAELSRAVSCPPTASVGGGSARARVMPTAPGAQVRTAGTLWPHARSQAARVRCASAAPEHASGTHWRKNTLHCHRSTALHSAPKPQPPAWGTGHVPAGQHTEGAGACALQLLAQRPARQHESPQTISAPAQHVFPFWVHAPLQHFPSQHASLSSQQVSPQGLAPSRQHWRRSVVHRDGEQQAPPQVVCPVSRQHPADSEHSCGAVQHS